MATIKDLKKRIGTVKNTQQTTRAMKMVSAAKLRRAQEAIQSQRPYAKRLGELVQKLAGMVEGEIDSPYVKSSESSPEAGAGKKLLLVLFTSDRGLCGGFNSNIIKGAHRWMLANGASYESIQFGYLGRKGYDFYKTKKVNQGPYFSELGGKVTFAKAKKLSDALVELYTSGQVDEIKFIYNEFKNAVTQKVVTETFLPLENLGVKDQAASAGSPASSALNDETLDQTMYIVKPSVEEVLKELLNKHFPIQTFRVLLDSQASEHGARMSSMENATKNAGEMIRKLSLQYNKQRQAGITKELLEIISGSESQKSS